MMILSLFLVACAGQEKKGAPEQPPEQTTTLGESVSKVKNEATDTATQPLNDLNLRQGKIPAVLLEARKAPYQQPANQSCEALDAEVKALDATLGPDFDAPSTRESKESLAKRGVGVVTDVATDAAKSAVAVAVPYRGWIRKLSGAEKHSEEFASAIAAGGMRRAFLKGFRQARGCATPG